MIAYFDNVPKLLFANLNQSGYTIWNCSFGYNGKHGYMVVFGLDFIYDQSMSFQGLLQCVSAI
jgi:hypothetical protein